MTGALAHCAKCEMTTAHVDGACRRCATVAQYRKRKPMSPETKQRLRALAEWRKGERAIDPRLG